MEHTLVPLPVCDLPWSSNVSQSFQILSDIFRNATTVLTHENYNTHHIQYHGETVANDVLPLLFAIEASASQEGVPADWLQAAAEQFEGLVFELAKAEQTMLGM